MKKRFSFSVMIASLSLSHVYAQEVTPQLVQQELEQAQRDFEIAQKMFIPWYTGPLITGSASNVPKGMWNIQGYLFFDTQYAAFTNNRKSVNVPNIYTLLPLLLVQNGITEWLDLTVIGQGIFRWSQGRSAQEFGDTSITFGLQILKQGPYVPSIRFTIGESFPTGKYQRLSSTKSGIDASGSGAYETTIGLNLNKILWWLKLHPISLRFSTTYAIPDQDVSVKGFNSYGGGFGTDGRVNVGDTLNADLGIEVSLTQKWVFANDIAYTYSTKSTFSGTPGVTALAAEAANGAPSSDQLSIAPAIEYNVSDKGGFIGGIWFPITGRNSSNFIAVILSYTQLF